MITLTKSYYLNTRNIQNCQGDRCNEHNIQPNKKTIFFSQEDKKGKKSVIFLVILIIN